MMDLINDTETKYEEYERLLLERDQLDKESNQIWVAYLQQFGELITENYETKLECIKCKKIISYYQAALNHGGDVDAAAMERYLEKEMAGYNAELRRMLGQNQAAKSAERSSAYEVQRAKTLYRRLARLVHPDINPETDRSEELRALWQRIMDAYHRNDVRALSELEVLVRRVLAELGISDEKIEIPDIDQKIDAVKEEIYEITHTEPYVLHIFVDDEEVGEKRKTEFQEELESYKKYLKELNEIILQMLQGGGLKIHVQ